MSTDAPAQPAPLQEQRLGQLSGDRACVKCSFNLAGQHIVREAHYGLLIVRCPECGTPAALQEYPVLGRWAPRLGFALIGIWIALLLASMVATGALSALISYGAAEDLSAPFQQKAFQAASDFTLAKTKDVGPQPQNFNAYSAPLDETWWPNLPPDKFFADSGGWRGAIDWTKLWYWYFVFGVGIPIGIGYAVAIPRRSWIRPVLITGIIVGIATLILAMSVSKTSLWTPGGSVWQVRDLAFGLVCWRLFMLTLGAAAAALLIGQYTGRPVARAMVRLLLHPRYWPLLAFLWIADNKPLPRPLPGPLPGPLPRP